MARRFQARNRLATITEINVTPLLDLAFSLLIIFMITAPLLEQAIEIELPVESPQPAAERPLRMHSLGIDRDGRLFWDGEPVSAELLGVLLDRLAEQPDPPLLSLRADASLPYQQIITVLDMARVRGLARVHLETRPE